MNINLRPVPPLLLAAVCLASPTVGRGRQADRGLALSGPAPVASLPAGAKRYALVVGIDDYEDPQVPPLAGAVNDAKALVDALVRYAGFPLENVKLLTTDQPRGRQPTRGNILRQLSNVLATVPEDGLLFIAFAGHGINRNQMAYVLPSDGQVSDDVELIEQTAVNVTLVQEWVQRAAVRQVIVVMDACRTQPEGRGEADERLTDAFVRTFDFDVRNRDIEAFATVFSASLGQAAYENKEMKQGYFTWELVEGLKGRAANERGEVTLARLIKHLEEQVPRRVLFDLGPGRSQRPFAIVAGYRADELVLAVAHPPRRVDTSSVEAVFWSTIQNSTYPEDFQAYLEKYPKGEFAALARIRLEKLPAAHKPEAGTQNGSGKTTGTLAGTVFDGDGATLGAATVTVTDESKKRRRATVTGPDGVFRVPFLPPGKYTVEISKDGYDTVALEGFPVLVATTNTIVPPPTLKRRAK